MHALNWRRRTEISSKKFKLYLKSTLTAFLENMAYRKKQVPIIYKNNILTYNQIIARAFN